MKTDRITILALAGAFALSAAPALALPSQAPDNPGSSNVPSDAGSQAPSDPGSQGTANKPATPGPKAGMPAKAKAYGKYCSTQSRKHVAGQQGTPFSLCVTAMAKVANGKANPRTACKTESRKHVAGEKGTPFSRCVSGAAKLLSDQQAAEDDTTSTDTTSTDTSSTDTSSTDTSSTDTTSS